LTKIVEDAQFKLEIIIISIKIASDIALAMTGLIKKRREGGVIARAMPEAISLSW